MTTSTGIVNPSKGISGLFNRLLARNVDRVLAIPGRRLYNRYLRASSNVEQAQLSVLREILNYASDTVIGKKYGFSHIRSYADYLAAVPVMDYEDHRPFVDRHVAGEENVLFPGKPMMYTRTSGTTAAPKLIPITPFNFERTIRNRGKLWLYGLSRQFNGIYDGKDFTLVSPSVDGHTADGVPFGALSGMIYQNIPGFVKLVHTIPYEIICIRDYTARAYALLRFGVPSNVTAVFTGNPSTVLNLAIKADEWKERLIRDVHDGTIDEEFAIEPHIRATARAMLMPAPDRAAQLARMAEARGRLMPTDYWPDLKLVHTWTNGNCALVLPKLREWYPETIPVLDFGYIASEINATDLIDAETNGSHLAILSAFFEFSPLEEGEAPRTFLMAHQLEAGRRYYIYVTTYSGLYRYNMYDVIEVVKHFNGVPIFRFLYKSNGITSLQGEKLSERQFIDAMQAASAATGASVGFFAGCAHHAENRYDVFAELPGTLSAEQRDGFVTALDHSLCAFNIEYAAKRSSERLHMPRLIPLVDNAFQRFRALRLEEGAFEGQLKWIHLSDSKTVRERMQKLVRTQP